MQGHYDGKRLLITGGSSGIGRATAELAASMGANVALVARRQSLLDETLQSLRRVALRADQRFVALALDIGDRAAVQAAAPQVLRALGGLDLLINNAGVAHVGYLERETPEAYERMMRINYFGSVWVTQAFLPHFMQAKRGQIAYVSSVLGLMGVFGYTAYCASKHALTGYADALRQDLLRYGVGVSVLFPADTDTPQLAEENRHKPGETAALAGMIRTAAPADVALAFLKGLARRQYHIVPGLDNKATLWGVRHFPAVARRVIDHDLRKYWRRNA